MLGPGKYDDVLTTARERTGGSCILIVIDGKQGSGFACQTDLMALQRLPQMLRHIADQIEKDGMV